MPRTLVMELRNIESAMSQERPVTCPAGEAVAETLEGPACRCRLETMMTGSRSLITVARDISTWSNFCTGRNDIDSRSGHEVCPTWLAAREIERQGLPLRTLTETSGVRRSFGMEDIEEIEERRAAGDIDGARKIQERIAEARREQGLRDVGKG